MAYDLNNPFAAEMARAYGVEGLSRSSSRFGVGAISRGVTASRDFVREGLGDFARLGPSPRMAALRREAVGLGMVPLTGAWCGTGMRGLGDAVYETSPEHKALLTKRVDDLSARASMAQQGEITEVFSLLNAATPWTDSSWGILGPAYDSWEELNRKMYMVQGTSAASMGLRAFQAPGALEENRLAASLAQDVIDAEAAGLGADAAAARAAVAANELRRRAGVPPPSKWEIPDLSGPLKLAAGAVAVLVLGPPLLNAIGGRR